MIFATVYIYIYIADNALQEVEALNKTLSTAHFIYFTFHESF